MRTERPTCRECACVKVCEYFENENARNLDETCPLCNWENYFVPKREWISVEERLPEPYKTVLVFCRNGFNTFQSVSEMLDENGIRWSAVCGIPVTHWMPLPEAPKGGAEIEKLIYKYDDEYGTIYDLDEEGFAELKKKYTEE